MVSTLPDDALRRHQAAAVRMCTAASRCASGQGAGAVEQGDEADEAFGGKPAPPGCRPEVPPHARAGLGWTRAPLRSLSPVFDGP